MSNIRIVYKKQNSTIGVLIPTDEALQFATVEQIAEKDVPKDLAYRIVEDSEIPSDRTYREAWEWDNSWTPDGFGGESNEFDSELLAKYKELTDGN